MSEPSPRLAYSLFMLLAAAVFLLARRVLPVPSSLAQLTRQQRLGLTLAAFIGGALGAKLPFALDSEVAFWRAQAWFTDGKTITTGLAGAYLAVEVAKWGLGVRAKTGDSYALPLALALALGRWGCFFNGCCYGIATTLPWGVDFGDGVWRHPTQIYESLFHFFMAGALLMLAFRDALPRQRLKLYLIAYCAFRFATEYLRPAPAAWLGLTFYQWVALVFAAALAVQWRLDRSLATAVV